MLSILTAERIICFFATLPMRWKHPETCVPMAANRLLGRVRHATGLHHTAYKQRQQRQRRACIAVAFAVQPVTFVCSGLGCCQRLVPVALHLKGSSTGDDGVQLRAVAQGPRHQKAWQEAGEGTGLLLVEGQQPIHGLDTDVMDACMHAGIVTSWRSCHHTYVCVVCWYARPDIAYHMLIAIADHQTHALTAT